MRVTAEVTPHHLTLTDECVTSLDPNFKMNPPLRAETDRRALVEALKSGLIDCVATDHAPHAQQEKEVPFEDAPFGTIGLETAFAVLYTGLVVTKQLPLGVLVARMSQAPARIAGIPAPTIAPASRPTSASSTARRAGGRGRRAALQVGQLGLAGPDPAGARDSHGRRRPRGLRRPPCLARRSSSWRTAPRFEAKRWPAPARWAARSSSTRRMTRLSGDRHRPLVLRSDHHLHVPAERQLRRRPRARRVDQAHARAIIARELTNYRFNRASTPAGSTG